MRDLADPDRWELYRSERSETDSEVPKVRIIYPLLGRELIFGWIALNIKTQWVVWTFVERILRCTGLMSSNVDCTRVSVCKGIFDTKLQSSGASLLVFLNVYHKRVGNEKWSFSTVRLDPQMFEKHWSNRVTLRDVRSSSITGVRWTLLLRRFYVSCIYL